VSLFFGGFFVLNASILTRACRLLLTYSLTCQSELSKSQKALLERWVQAEKSKHGEEELLEKWSISREEYASFVGKLV
jgi:hypothetical protein